MSVGLIIIFKKKIERIVQGLIRKRLMPLILYLWATPYIIMVYLRL